LFSVWYDFTMFYRTFGREAASILFKAAVAVVSVIFVFVFFSAYYELDTVSDGSCNIAVLPIEGVILPFYGYDEYELVITPKTVRDFVASAEADTNIKGILFEINSPGGTPVAAEQISNIISSTNLHTISLIGDVGASGGYLVAAAADSIIASPMSDVGSIGVTMSYVEESQKNEEEGLTFVPLSTGKYKDAGNPNKPLTDEERTLFERDLAIVHDEFVRQIATLRGKAPEEIQALADGSSMPGLRALEAGLVDTLGGRAEARNEFSATLGLAAEDIEFCEYEPATMFY
jgi:protease IV